MAGRIRQADIQALRDRADIADIVGAYTTLKRAGGKLKGLCPFHQEKSPSFTVDPGVGLYHCFGCQAGGDIYKFVMELEGFDFTEAVEHLARRTGFTLTYEDLTSGQRRALGERSLLQEVNARAVEFFEKTLYSDEGAPVREYLKERGFGKEDATNFRLGFAPNDWERMVRELTAEGVDQAALVKVGLAVRNNRGGLRDRFRGRLMFPIQDAGGDVIGFGGRVLPMLDYGDFDPPKYLNTAETPLYHKSRVLYGLPQARASMSREGQVLVCEGYTDVMALHQAGLTNAVATCGTAMGEDHVRLLTKYAPRLVLAFDGDAAGAGAAARAWEIARGFDVDVRVLVLPPGQDPADVVRGEDGAATLRKMLDDAESIIPFTIRRTIDGHDLATEEGRTQALQASVALLKQVDDPDLRRSYARTEIADRIGMSIEFVTQTASRAGVNLDRHQGVATRSTGRREDTSADAARARLERSALRAAIQRPNILPDAWYEVTAEDFLHPVARGVFTALEAAGGAGVEVTSVIEACPTDSEREVVRALQMEEDPLVGQEAHVHELVKRLLLPRVERGIATAKAELERSNPATEPEEYAARFRAIVALELRRRELRQAAE